MDRKNSKKTLDGEKVLKALTKKAGLTVPEVIEKLGVPAYRDLEVRKLLHGLVSGGKAASKPRSGDRGRFTGRPPMEYRSV